MSNMNPDPASNANEQPQRQLILQKIYLRDTSLEVPHAPVIFNERWDPRVQVDLDTRAEALSENEFHVLLRVTVTASLESRTAFLVEVQQAGMFYVAGLNEQELGHVLGSYCPNILFPFAREAISDLVTRAGFPQMLLAPVNFDALYAQQLGQQQRLN
jgi:preprotein translocase subunit SecB